MPPRKTADSSAEGKVLSGLKRRKGSDNRLCLAQRNLGGGEKERRKKRENNMERGYHFKKSELKY